LAKEVKSEGAFEPIQSIGRSGRERPSRVASQMHRLSVVALTEQRRKCGAELANLVDNHTGLAL
jgi:hypothetical protein